VGLGETQGRIDQRRYRSSEDTGQPEDSNTVTRKGGRLGATRRTTGRYNRTTAASGVTCGNSREARWGQGLGETRGLAKDGNEGRGSEGNLKPGRRLQHEELRTRGNLLTYPQAGKVDEMDRATRGDHHIDAGDASLRLLR